MDHILVLGFGAPAVREEVMPFLRTMAAKAPLPEGCLKDVAAQYELIGGGSPYLRHAQIFVSSLRESLRERQIHFTVFLAMRNWHPLIPDVLAEIKEGSLSHGFVVILSPFRSPASHGVYLSEIEKAQSAIGGREVRYDFVKRWFDNPLFIQAHIDRIQEVLCRLPENEPARTTLVFSAHSIPFEMARRCDYAKEMEEVCHRIADGLGHSNWVIAYQSKSGDGRQPWLGPDLKDIIERLRGKGTGRLIVDPVGFLCDHAEILYDLDWEARRHAQKEGMEYLRAATVLDHPLIIRMFTEIIHEAAGGLPRR